MKKVLIFQITGLLLLINNIYSLGQQDDFSVEKVLVLRNYENLYNSTDYNDLSLIFNAALLDPITNEIFQHNNWNNLSNDIFLDEITNWSSENLIHIQKTIEYRSSPGKDPWGYGNKSPNYKIMLPIEMKEISKFTGNISGHCTSLAFFISSFLIQKGIEAENILIVRCKGHTVVIFKWINKIYGISNNCISRLDSKMIENLNEKGILGFYNQNYSYKRDFLLPIDILTISESLLENLINSDSIDKDYIDKTYNLNLIDYASQRIDVEHPELYITISSENYHIEKLVSEISTDKEIITWVQENIENIEASDRNDYLQIAEQTIVFKNGSIVDKAVLIASLFKLKGIQSEIIITDSDTYITYNDLMYSVKSNSFGDFSPKNLRERIKIEI